MTALNDEFARRGLLRKGDVMRALQINHVALRFLIAQRQLRVTLFDWKGHDQYGITSDQVENVEAVFRNGVIRLIPRS